MVGNSRSMTGARDRFKMFRSSVMQSSLSFSNIQILAVLTTSLIHDVCEVIVTAPQHPQSNEFERCHSTQDKRIRY